MNLSLTNLTEGQVINILSEILPVSVLAKITEKKLRNIDMSNAEMISLLMYACAKHSPKIS